MTASGSIPTTEASWARSLDADDALGPTRSEFLIPIGPDGSHLAYLSGNSLGLPPRTARAYVDAELDRWAALGVAGHLTGGPGWAAYHELFADPLARLVGAEPGEVVAMNSLTVNLHLLLISFYRPTRYRHKILIESNAFPSDHFAVTSQIRQRGFDPAGSLVVVGPRPGEDLLHPDDLVAAIEHHGDELATVLLPGVHYYTGQVLPLARITSAAVAAGATVGFDLAHAVGNVPLSLHDWGVDFAVWCSYKYLNAGPGAVGAAYVHRRHHHDPDLPKLLGWWGTRADTRFEMATEFEAIPTVESWQLSNAPVLSMAALKASLDLFDRVGGIGTLRAKSEQQILYLDHLLDAVIGDRVEVVTPRALAERGCQVSLRVSGSRPGREVQRLLDAGGVSCDWRHPDVIRIAPVPLYNSFEDIHRFVTVLDGALS